MSVSTQTGSIRTAIEQTNQQFMETFRRQDAAGMAAHYTDDGQALPPGGPLASGPEAIRQIWQRAFDAGLTDATLQTREVEAFGDMAYEVGEYTILAGGHVADRGKYIVIWKLDGGQWKLHRDIWNSNGQAAE